MSTLEHAHHLYDRGVIGIGLLLDVMYWDAKMKMRATCIGAMLRFDDAAYRHDLERYYGRSLSESEVAASRRGIDLGVRRH